MPERYRSAYPPRRDAGRSGAGSGAVILRFAHPRNPFCSDLRREPRRPASPLTHMRRSRRAETRRDGARKAPEIAGFQRLSANTQPSQSVETLR